MQNLFVVYKSILFIATGISFVLMILVGAAGRKTRNTRPPFAVGIQAEHRRLVNRLFGVTIFVIFLVEGVGRLVFHAIGHPMIFWFHLIFFAIPFFVIFLFLRFLLPGNSTLFARRRIHRRWGKICLGFGIGTNILGTYLIYIQRLP